MPRPTKHCRQMALSKRSKLILLFPSLLILMLIVFSVLKISGSSVGVFSLLYGDSTNDSHALFSTPRGVRSDEWLVNTPMVVAQANNHYKRINQNVGDGQDMSLIVDVPYKEWSVLFKPQNWSFFVMPLENAFAFKWWFLLVALLMACYFLVLELFPGSIIRAILVSLLVGLSPFIAWWYQTITIMPLVYSLLLILLFIKLLKAQDWRIKLPIALSAAYILSCFGLLLYPPFQIGCILVSTVFIIGYFLDNYKQGNRLGTLRQNWRYILIAVLLPLMVILIFLSTRKGAVGSITHTVYPGTRVITSGGTNPLLSFSSFLSPNLQYDQKAAQGYLGNQSEASNFIFIAPFLLIPSLYLIIKRFRGGKILWGLGLINLLILFFLTRMYIITPAWIEPVYKLFLLQKVPNTRLIIGLGFAGVLQLILLMKAYDEIKLSKKERWALGFAAGLLGLIVMLAIGRYTIHHYPVFIASRLKVIVFAIWVSTGILLISARRLALGIGVLVAFSLLSIYKVNPLYSGLSPLTNSPITQAIKASPPSSTWVVLDDRLLIDYPILAGRRSIDGVNFYPQFKLWQQLDPDKKYDFVYNRYAHVVFSDDPQLKSTFTLKYADNFLVKFDACSNFIKNNDQYVLSPNKVNTGCLKFVGPIKLQRSPLYIYKISNT